MCPYVSVQQSATACGVQAEREEEAPAAQPGRSSAAPVPRPSTGHRPSQPIAMSGTPSSYKVGRALLSGRAWPGVAHAQGGQLAKGTSREPSGGAVGLGFRV